MVEKVQRKNHGYLKKCLQYKGILECILKGMLFSEETVEVLQKRTWILIKAQVCNSIVNDRKRK